MSSIAKTIPLADSWSMHGNGAGWWIQMIVVMVLFWAAVIFGVVWLIRGGPNSRPEGLTKTPEPRTESPTEILDRRFAEGGISADDYWARRKVLVNGSAESSGAHGEESVTAARRGGG